VSSLLGLFLQSDGEIRLAGLGWIVEGGAFPGTFGGTEEKSLLGFFGEAGETGFAGGIGPDFEIQLVSAQESICDVYPDRGRIDGRTGSVGNNEISGAGTDAAVDHRHGFRVRSSLGSQGRQEEHGQHVLKMKAARTTLPQCQVSLRSDPLRRIPPKARMHLPFVSLSEGNWAQLPSSF